MTRSWCTTARNGPRSPQLEKARTQQRRPNAAKNKNKLKKKKKKRTEAGQAYPGTGPQAVV